MILTLSTHGHVCCARLNKDQRILPVMSFEWPFNCLMTEGFSETLHTVRVPSDAP